MKKVIWGGAILTGIGCMIFTALHLQAIAITCGTFFYHLAMRLAVGYMMLLVPRKFDPQAGWFAERKWEKKLYNLLCVRRWKHVVPSYNPQDFDMNKHTPQEIVQTMCVSELVHEIIVLLSFIPLFFAIPFGEFIVFLLTSLASAAFDSVFVILQRFNRPRMVRLVQRRG